MRCEIRPGRAWAVAAGDAVAVFEPDTPTSTLAAAHALLGAARGANSIAAALEQLRRPIMVAISDSQGARVIRWKNVPLRADDEDIALTDQTAGQQQVTPANLLEFGNVAELADGTVPLLDGVAGVSAVRVTLSRASHDIPGFIARAVDINVDDDTDEIPVFSAATPPETLRSSAAYADELAMMLASGASVPLDRGVILGRRPHSSGEDGTLPPRLVAIGNESSVVSRNHLALRWRDGQLLAEDLGSTNGSSIARSGTVMQRLLPAHPVPVGIGDALVLGDGITVTIGASMGSSDLLQAANRS